MIILSLVFALILLILFLIIFLYLFLGGIFLFTGAPYVPTRLEKVKTILKLANPKSGEVLYDLGSGDGRIVIEAVKNYDVRAVGIEINPFLVYISRKKIKKLGLENKAKIYWGNLFRKDISEADIVIIYLTQWANNMLEKKLISQLKPGARIVSLSFVFKKISLVNSEGNIRLYKVS